MQSTLSAGVGGSGSKQSGTNPAGTGNTESGILEGLQLLSAASLTRAGTSKLALDVSLVQSQLQFAVEMH